MNTPDIRPTAVLGFLGPLCSHALGYKGPGRLPVVRTGLLRAKRVSSSSGGDVKPALVKARRRIPVNQQRLRVSLSANRADSRADCKGARCIRALWLWFTL